MAKKTTTPSPTAYSYLRFSSPDQAAGDSVRRQEELRDAWLRRTGATLDTSISLRDEGVSAYTVTHRDNPDRNALAAFLELVRRGRVARGSFFVVESLDRLSREHIRPALTLLLNLIEAGIRVVQLLPVETVYDEKVEPMHLLMAIMELSRGHSESRLKSERVGGAWREKKRAAAETKEPITRKVPSWLRVEGGRFILDKEKAATIWHIYKLASDGYGLGAITKKLNAEGVTPIGRADYWARSYVAKLLATRATIGEYQPHRGRNGSRKPDGAPVAGYYPPVVSEDRWHAARAALESRRNKGGRLGQNVNLFANLLRDARDGGSLHRVNKGEKSGGAVLVSYKAALGVAGTKYVSFPLDVFEEKILEELREIDPRKILLRGDDAADRVLALTGKLSEIESRIDAIKGQLVDGGDVASLVEVLRSLDERRSTAARELATAKHEAASPLSQAWGECRSLVGALRAVPDPEAARVRLRSALRRIVENIHCLFVVNGAFRLAAVRMQFREGKHRDFLIVHRPEHANAASSTPAKMWVRSFVKLTGKGELDLRKRRDAAKLADLLAKLDLRDLTRSA